MDNKIFLSAQQLKFTLLINTSKIIHLFFFHYSVETGFISPKQTNLPPGSLHL